MASSNDLNELRKAFEKQIRKEEDTSTENEQKLLKAITIYVCKQKGVSPVLGYKPEDILTFLEKPVSQIKECLGGEWGEFPNEKLEDLIYILNKKVKKSDKLTEW